MNIAKIDKLNSEATKYIIEAGLKMFEKEYIPLVLEGNINNVKELIIRIASSLSDISFLHEAERKNIFTLLRQNLWTHAVMLLIPEDLRAIN